MQTRHIIAFGFFVMGLALVYASGLTPDIDFKTLVLMRTAQTCGLAFLFVPISTIAYQTLPRELNGDGAALYSMFRNVFGSIGISASTAMVTQQGQVRGTYLSQWTSPLNPPYNQLVQTYEHTLRTLGRAAGSLHEAAVGRIYQVFSTQVSIMAYADVFMYCSYIAFAVVPLCFFLLSSGKGGARPGGGH